MADYAQWPDASAHAHSKLLPKMALCRRALGMHFCARRHFLKTVYHKRHLSENVSSKPRASGEPADHVLYTQEHFALKDSLRKVTKCISYCRGHVILFTNLSYLAVILLPFLKSNMPPLKKYFELFYYIWT